MQKINLNALKKAAALLFLSFGLVFSTIAYAIDSPVTFLQSTADRVVTQLTQHKAQLKTHPVLVHKIVKDTLLPEVDVDLMAKYVLGRATWSQMSVAEKQNFISEFTTLVINTYASGMAEYNNETIKFLPLREGYEDKNRLQVNSVVVRKSGPSINLSYRVYKKGAQWKIYDISVEGISILNSFRSQFASELQKGSIQALIKKLSEHNNNSAS